MVTKKELKGLELSLDEYFEYILESKANGQHTQARELFGKLSGGQRLDFFLYVDKLYFYEVEENELLTEMINFRQYFNI